MSASRPSPTESPRGRAAGRAARPFRLRAVLFDFDGTLTRPGALDFPAVKREVGCPPDQYVLEWILSLPPGEARDAAMLALERFELAAADASAPNAGAEELVDWLREQGLSVGVLTRNGLSAVERALDGFSSLAVADFDVVVTRDDGALAPKPAPDGVLHAAAAMGVPAEETLVVGDFLLDMRAGRAAGAVTAYLLNHRAPGGGEQADAGATGGGAEVAAAAAGDGAEVGAEAADCDFVVGRLSELTEVVRLGLPLAPGKLPHERLAAFLAGLPADRTLLVPAAVGEDFAALDLQGAELLVAHGDPITLGGHDAEAAAVLVNVNDIATAGAEPRWLLATVLLPPDSTPSEAARLLERLAAAAAATGVTLAGGHTEVTDAVTRPVVSLTALATAARADLKDKRTVSGGDRLLLTKALAMEGTALLAAELGPRLTALGMSPAELEACRALQGRISVVPEARIARDVPGVRAMHDVTEGGLAGALSELAAATGRGVLVHRELIPVSPETRRLCALLGVDPLGLIASGSLLVCCSPAEAPGALAALAAADIPAADIGEITEEGAAVTALERGRPAPWPHFTTDEAARLLTGHRPAPKRG